MYIDITMEQSAKNIAHSTIIKRIIPSDGVVKIH